MKYKVYGVKYYGCSDWSQVHESEFDPKDTDIEEFEVIGSTDQTLEEFTGI